ncbi:hypothetical protein JX265_013453 [Neoarthrinium moseri]|uniref:Uncharacterized protein n=1 Tax=Neoarthrinium moseri TaxID=1658444 RepID=A0A9Q0AHN0_9PEZI|nr:uncharacterized protein JN550_013012 [Neoarthrinium moseri]KAI1841353.1 hypothetical protein JX266_012434 [Neoarthrinium moseri]KAI1850174.1 hypothetical protein JX265_013453 [Neoarthrinium moseri]KAI1857814.1 hypothetical protein JN550_013012 [Neoarthrinium moseri]
MLLTRVAGASALFMSIVTASPIEKRDFDAQLTFFKVNGGSYTVSVPADSARAEVVKITEPEEVAVVSSAGGATCSIKGVKGVDVVIVGQRSTQILPAQPIDTVYCLQL